MTSMWVQKLKNSPKSAIFDFSPCQISFNLYSALILGYLPSIPSPFKDL